MAGIGVAQTFSVQLLGFDAIQRKLRAMPVKLEKAIIRTAVKKATQELRDATKAEAPRGETGLLQKAIATRTYKRHKKGTFAMFVGWKRSMYDKLRAASGTVAGRSRHQKATGERVRFFYPVAVELGTKDVPANAFMRRAFDKNKVRLARMMELEIWRGIRQAVEAKII